MSYLFQKLESKSSLKSVFIFLGLFILMLNIINGSLVGVEKLKQFFTF